MGAACLLLVQPPPLVWTWVCRQATPNKARVTLGRRDMPAASVVVRAPHIPSRHAVS